jgi:hypothetical protein
MSAVDQRLRWVRWDHYHDTSVAEGFLGNSDVVPGVMKTALAARHSAGTHQTCYGTEKQGQV